MSDWLSNIDDRVMLDKSRLKEEYERGRRAGIAHAVKRRRAGIAHAVKRLREMAAAAKKARDESARMVLDDAADELEREAKGGAG